MPRTGKSDRIRVRMYRQGLGDCFLITLLDGDKPFHILIDCGVVVGTPHGAATIKQVAADVKEACGGKLDVVVATHEHWDHLSGYVHAREIFDAIEIGQVWFAWTEDPKHPLARQLRKERRERIGALKAALAAMYSTELNAGLGIALAEITEFFGDVIDASAAPGSTTEDALEYLREREDAEVLYLRPGQEPIEVGESKNGFRIFIMGPPEDAASLRRSRPRKGEAYENAFGLSAEAAFLEPPQHERTPLAGTDEPSLPPTESLLQYPFDAQYCISEDEAREHAFFRDHYGFTPTESDEWRRIYTDWLQSASQLALDLDNDTNNTSLVLAIELPNGQFLLFPGDAQVGNWLSWDTYEWESRDKRPLRLSQILEKTVFYKVAHHGSHNATLRAILERMSHRDLIAFIPVDEGVARTKRWNMPFPPLLQRLQEITGGRVMRADKGCPTARDLQRVRRLDARQRRDFTEAIHEHDLYIDVTFKIR
jgi:beta-lactamase superfamily II metal-dependent hydrolase